MIIVEGCDNTGKTTLIDMLCEEIPQLVRAPKSPGPASAEELSDYMDEYLWKKTPGETHPMIFDRFPLPSELVYGYALRTGPVLETAQLIKYSAILATHQPLMIYCFRDMEKILETFDEREQLEGVKENIQKILFYYQDYLTRLSWYVSTFYCLDDPLSYRDMVKVVQTYLQKGEGIKI